MSRDTSGMSGRCCVLDAKGLGTDAAAATPRMEKLNLGNDRAAAEPTRRPQDASAPGRSTESESLPSMSGSESFKRSVDDATRYLEVLASAQKLDDRTTMAIAASEVRVALNHASRAVAAASVAARPAMQARLDALTARSTPLLEHAPDEVHEPKANETAKETPESEEEDSEKLERLSKIVHTTHVVYDNFEKVVEYNEAKDLLKHDAQLPHLIRHALKQLVGLKKRVAQRPIAKVIEKLDEAEQELAQLATEYKEIHAEVPTALKLVRELKSNRVVTSVFGVVSKSETGRIAMKTAKAVTSTTLGRLLGAMAIATDTLKQFVDSPTEGAFKVADGALGGAGTALTMATMPGVDMLMEHFTPGWQPSATIHGAAHVITAIDEAVIEKDERPLERFHERSMKGLYGRPLQLASKTGEAIAQFLAERHFFQGD